jgi:hypothetical protein
MMPSATLTVVSKSTAWDGNPLEQAQFEPDAMSLDGRQFLARFLPAPKIDASWYCRPFATIAFVAKFRVKVSGLERSSRAGFVPETALVEPQLPQCSFGDLRRTSVIGFKS